MLNLREGHEVRQGRWSLMVGSAKEGCRVSWDDMGGVVRLYDTDGVTVDTLPANESNWQEVAHAGFVKRKVESPWVEAKP